VLYTISDANWISWQANLLWLYDELTDTETEAEAVNTAHIVARALREPDFEDGTWICSMIKECVFLVPKT